MIEPPATTPGQPGDCLALAEKPNIVFVDDDSHVHDGFRRVLRNQRDTWSMNFATSAHEALQLVEAGGVDTVVTDVMMPVKSGLDLLEEMQADEDTRSIPVIVVTGSSDHDLKCRALDLGATDLLAKPVDRAELLARLRSSLRLKACHDEIRICNRTLQSKVAARTAELANSRVEMIWRLAKLAEMRDEDTGNHVVRVSHYCRAIAETMGLDCPYVEQLFLTSPLHDVGKITIPDAILHKPGTLTADEWAIMRAHCKLGAEILRRDIAGPGRVVDWYETSVSLLGTGEDDSLLDAAASIALTHHERWDGGGYPNRLAGEQIPLQSRIVAVADCYDALCSARPYKPAFSHEQARALLEKEAGLHFDPEVLAAFLRAADAFQAVRADFADANSLFAVPPVCRGGS
ncbi:MAG TPA: HD domain-containing phosphohydrolase [Planctomycetaceae bacterium]|jgi:putative two-component system response regulator